MKRLRYAHNVAYLFAKIQIINSGQFKPNVQNFGLGIENTKERLRILFEEKAKLSAA